MERKDPKPAAHVPNERAREPLGRGGRERETWSPPKDEEGISNDEREEDPSAEEAIDPSKD